MLRKSVVTLAILLCSLASQVYALGLGTVTVESYLNQPLSVRIEILDLGDTRLQDITVQMASVDDFARFNIERLGFLSNVRFRVEETASGNYVYLSTNQIVREPYLSFILETRWPNGRLLSEHTILMDLPVFNDQPDTSSDAAQVRRPISPVLQEPDRNSVAQPFVDSTATRPQTVAPASSSVAPVLEPEVIAPESDPVSEPSETPAPSEPLPESAALSEEEPAAAIAETVEEVADEPVQDAIAEPELIAEADVPAAPEEAPVVDETPVADEMPVAEDEPMAEEEISSAQQEETPAEEGEEPTVEVAAEDSVIEVEAEDAAIATAAAPEPAAIPEPAAPETITTSASDTLTSIAQQVRPDDSVSLQQTMLAIQELNPDAFIDGNINRLRSGQVLRVPDREEIAAVDAADAVSEVARQNQEIADVQPLAAPADVTPDQDQANGQLSVVSADDSIDASGAGGELDDEENAELDRRIAELENQLALRQEEADRARIEREELDSRLADLEQQIDAAEELLRLQDLQLAQLQESIAQAAADAEAEAAAQAAAAEVQAEIAQPTPAGGSMVDDIMRILTGNTMMMVFGVVLVVLLLVVLLLRRNRAAAAREEDELDELAEQEFDANADNTETTDPTSTDAGGDDAEDFDQELDDILAVTGDDEAAEEAMASDAEVADIEENPIAQAEILIAHEQFAQAAELLKAAAANGDEDRAINLKLMDVLALDGDHAAFEAEAELIAQEQSPRLDRAVNDLREKHGIAIKQEADDEFDAISFDDEIDAADSDETEIEETAEEEAESEVAETEAEPEPEQEQEEDDDDEASFLDDLGIDLDSFDAESDDDLEFSDELSAEQEDAGEVGDDAEKSDAEDLDLDVSDEDVDLTFDLGEGDEADANEAEETVAEEPADAADDTVLDLDEPGEAELASGDSKDADELDIESFEFDAAEATDVSEETVAEDEELEIESFAFDADDLKPAEEEDEPEVEIDSENLLDFDLGDDAEDSDKDSEQVAEPEVEIDAENLMDFDLGDDDEEEVTDTAAETESGGEDIESFEFDIDESASTTVIEPAEAEEKEEQAEAAAETTVDDFDFDLDELDAGIEDSADASADEDDDVIDLASELEELDDSSAETDASASADEIDFDAIDDEGKAEEPPEDDLDDLEFLTDDDDDDDAVAIESVDDVEEVELLSDDDETATKLELAYAYQKMGDAEGAREILQEVVAEGSEDQVKEARELMAALDSAAD